jgi:hypothetical protein
LIRAEGGIVDLFHPVVSDPTDKGSYNRDKNETYEELCGDFDVFKEIHKASPIPIANELNKKKTGNMMAASFQG